MGLNALLEAPKQTESFHRIGVMQKQEFKAAKNTLLLREILEFLKISVQAVNNAKIFTIRKNLSSKQLLNIAEDCLIDPILEFFLLDSIPLDSYDWSVEVGYKFGITDNAGKTAQITIEDYLGEPFGQHEYVQTSTLYLFKGSLSRHDIEKIAQEFLGNPLIEDIKIQPILKNLKKIESSQIIDIHISDEALQSLSKERQLALNLEEMQAIRAFYSQNEIREERLRFGLPSAPTDVELEALAQTWSEHCKHKIFAAKIKYNENGKTEDINGLFSTYIKKTTEQLKAHVNWLVSVFTDNAGIIRFNDQYNLAFKVETHNSPSALDPFGGALTGILGVNRDILGAGIGARIFANTDIFCFAPPNYLGSIPERLQHPKRIFEGVCRGIEQGGNKSGIPTVNGSLIFDDRYLGKPLVYCGSAGIMPAKINGIPSHIKKILPGDLIFIAGGRTGKDGIHGATFSSEALHADSPSSAVQIGDPFTQKKLQDFLLEARDAGLYHTLTDNGAGGFSSSIGELAKLSGGCEIHLDKALTKYPGLLPWEILLSESQERMTFAVDPAHKESIQKLAALHEVECCFLGTFTDNGRFHVFYNGTTVALLPLDFLHDGLPQLHLEAEWKPRINRQLNIKSELSPKQLLNVILSRYNVCSKESIVRQYDHEVQGGSVLKPFTGKNADGPSDAAIIQPYEFMLSPLYQKEGIVLANGICPKYSEIDTYHMTACAIDEAIRNCVAVGGDPNFIAILDNFCWPDPIYHPEITPDGKHKLAQLVRANKALHDYALEFNTPIISGKDSMKNDYKIGNVKISVPPTLLISAIGKIHNIEKAVSMDFKKAGDCIYIIGMTKNELGMSELALMLNLVEGNVPQVNAKAGKKSYDAIYKAIQNELVASCHDCSDGGLGVAIAESSFAGGLGASISLFEIPKEGIYSDIELLFSESASRLIISIDPKNAKQFEQCMQGSIFARIGIVREDDSFLVQGLNKTTIIEDNIHSLKKSWQRPLEIRSLV